MGFIIIGPARSGKDTACEYLRDKYGYKFESSSMRAAQVVFSSLKEKYGYSTVEDCFEDRVNHREEWFNLITEYNDPKWRLVSEILEDNDIYCGLRNREELNGAKENCNIHLVVWIEASERLEELEGSGSITVTKDDADMMIDNNGTLEEFHHKLDVLASIMDNLNK